MSDEKWSRASLRISSNTMSAAEITHTLGLKPTSSYEKGTPLSKRNPKSAVRQQSVWILESGLDSSQPLAQHIACLVALVEEKIDVLKKLLPICDIDIFCGFSSESGQGGFVLNAALLKRITAIPIDIVLDLYPPANDEPESDSQFVESHLN